jgi:ABC-type nitrate/sulfonate/bicarbonate transport system substrate-binding protein
MKNRSAYLFVLFCAFLVPSNEPAEGAAPLAKVIMTSGSASERDGAIYVAQDQGFFRKHGST